MSSDGPEPRRAIAWSVDDSVLDRAPSAAEPSTTGPARPAREALAARFDVGDELGRGAMGVVYRAVDRASGREVALKVLNRAPTPTQLERLRREGVLTASLRHPGIVTVHTAGELDGVAYLAYELVEGARPLSTLLPLPPQQAARTVGAIAAAIEHAHSQGVLHRDLKPSNVMLDAQGQPRVIDFGLAHAAELDRMTQTGALVGTPTHMAPEQIRPDPEGPRWTPATEVWSLGVILYQALTGELPFEGQNLIDLARAIRRDPPTPPSEWVPGVDSALEAVCLRALAKAPEARYPSAQALADALHRASERPARAMRPQWVVLLALLAMATVSAVALAPPRTDPDLGAAPSATSLATAPTLPESRADALDTIEELLHTGRPGAAVALAEGSLERWPDTPALQEALVRALTRAGRPAQVDAALAAWTLDPPLAQLLALSRRAAAGEDVRRELRALQRATHGDELTSVRLTRLELAARNLPAAAGAIERAVGRAAASESLAAAVSAARARDGGVIARLPWHLRDLLAGCRLADAWRELAFYERAGDPSRALGPRARPPGEHERDGLTALADVNGWSRSEALRQEAALIEARLRGLASPEGLAAAQRAVALDTPAARRLAAELALEQRDSAAALGVLIGDTSPPAQVLRGQALLIANEPARAAEVLDDAWGPRLDPRIGQLLERALTRSAPGSKALLAVRARLGLLAGEHRQQAQRVVAPARRAITQPPERAQAGADALALDPLLHEARFYKGRGMFWLEPVEGFELMIEACSREPLYVTGTLRQMLTYRRITEGFAHGLAEPGFEVAPGRWAALSEAVLAAAAAEFEPAGPDRDERARVLLEAVLAEDPAEAVAWQLLPRVLIRQGELDYAEHALDIAEAAVPDSAIVYWYRALLAGARGEPQRRVLDLVSAARDRRYKLWHERGWSSDLYPELGDAREAPVYKQMMHR